MTAILKQIIEMFKAGFAEIGPAIDRKFTEFLRGFLS